MTCDHKFEVFGPTRCINCGWTPPAPPAKPRLRDLTPVRLKRDWTCMVDLPNGFRGTVVHIHPISGVMVEFCDGQGRGFTVDVPDDMVEPVDDAQWSRRRDAPAPGAGYCSCTVSPDCPAHGRKG